MSGEEPPAATPLALKLAARIARDGPIGVDEYMQACLQDPEHGYYRRRPAIGSSGDFITAPEISQVFGEIIGLWCAVVWQQMGSPPALRLVELGPGRGTLMRDALRAARLVPAFRAALQVELIESNAALETEQRATLKDEDVPLRWCSDFAAGTDPAIVIGNEFLDTLPVAQWVFHGGAWRRRCVDIDATGALSFADGLVDTRLATPAGLREPRDGDVYEYARRGAGVARCTARRPRRAPRRAVHRLRSPATGLWRHAAGRRRPPLCRPFAGRGGE